MLELPYLPAAVALSSVAAIGYWVGRLQTGAQRREIDQARREIDQAQAVASELESISHAIRQTLNSHQSSIIQFKDRVGQLGAGLNEAAWQELCQHIEQALAPTQRLTAQLAEAYEELRQQADRLLTMTEVRTDSLTGVGNRRMLEETLRTMFALFERYETPFSLLILDVDQLERINEDGGRQAGDRTLQKLAEVVRQTVRDTDVVARLGGDELAVVMPQTHLDQAALLADRLRQAVRVQAKATVSVGVASALDGDNPRSLLARSREALFAAKTDGRDCTFWHDGQSAERAQDTAAAVA